MKDKITNLTGQVTEVLEVRPLCGETHRIAHVRFYAGRKPMPIDVPIDDDISPGDYVRITKVDV